jgi:cell division protein FtsA
LPADDLIVGLDVGTTTVCAVIGQYNENNVLEITGVGTHPSSGLRRGVVVNIEATVKSIVSAVEAAEMMSGREVQDVYTGIAGAHIEGINSRGVVAVTGKDKEITKEDVDRVIDAAKAIVVPMDRAIMHVIPQEFVVDEQGGIKNPIGMIGVRLEAEVHIITGSVSSAQNILKSVNRAGLRVNEIILESLAASKAILSQDEKDLGVLLIDLGGGTSNIILFLEGSPYHTNIISIGGAQVTSDLSIILKTPLDSAEKIKKQHGCCYMDGAYEDEEVNIPGVGGRPPQKISRKRIVQIIQPRMAEIFSIIKEETDKKGYFNRLGGGVVLTGGGALLPGTAELAAEVFNLPARIGVPRRMGGLVEEYSSPLYATAVGLVMFGMDKGRTPGMDVQASERGFGFLKKLKQWLGEFF